MTTDHTNPHCPHQLECLCDPEEASETPEALTVEERMALEEARSWLPAKRCIARAGHDGGHLFASTDCIANPEDRGERCPATLTPEAPPAREPLVALDCIANLVQQALEDHPGDARLLRIEAIALGIADKLDPPDAKPPELPALPDNWAKDDSSPPGVTSYRALVGFGFVDIYSDGTVRQERNVTVTELHAVLSHHLGLTAPAADVRALEALADSWVRQDDTESQLMTLCALQLRDALTGKGAP